MTLSRREQSRRAIVAAARTVAARDVKAKRLGGSDWKDPNHRPAEIAEAVAEEIGWEFSEEEAREAVAAYRQARGNP